MLCIAHTVLSKDVLSVCISATHWYSVKMATHIIRLFLLSGSHTILVFPFQTLWQYSDRTPYLRRQMQGVWKNHDFTSISLYLRNTTRYSHSYYRMRIGNHTKACKCKWLTHALLKCVISNDLDWLGKIFNDTKHRAVCLWQLSCLFGPPQPSYNYLGLDLK